MIKRGLLVLHTRISQVLEKLNHTGDPQMMSLQQRNSADISVQILQIRVFKVRATRVELHHFCQVFHAAIMHIRPGQLDVTQCWSLKGTIHSHTITSMSKVATTTFKPNS